MPLAIAWGDVGFGIAGFIGLIVLSLAVPLAFGSLPQGVKNFLFDNFYWFFFGGIVLLLIWQNAD